MPKYAKIKSIRPIGKQDVYNMEVATYHNFSVENGLIIHNCMDAVRYFTNTVVMRNRKPYDDSVYNKGKSNNVTDEINTLLKYGNVF